MRTDPDMPAAKAADGLQTIAGHGPVLVLAPHPDDESLGCGLLLDALWRGGGHAHVACLTDGGASHPGSRAWPSGRLAALRRTELDRAVTLLGGLPRRDVSWLGYPDAAAHRAHGPGADPARDLAAIVDRLGVATLVAASPLDPHCDHEAGAAAALRLRDMRPGLRLFFYPVWSRWLARATGRPGTPPGTRPEPRSVHLVDRPARRAAKRAAIAAHESQDGRVVADAPDGFRMPDGFAAFFTETPEHYQEVTA